MTYYVATREIGTYKKVFAYSDDINAFFDYLRNYYRNSHCLQLTLNRIYDFKEIERIIIENSEYEIVEYFQNVYLRGFEVPYVDNYLAGFYNEIKDKIDQKKTGVYCYDQFLKFLGSIKIQNIINDLGDLEALYILDEEYRDKIYADK